ncbi:rhamnan synthesis F family protein [Roseovarius aquimarinus]|uniref:Rhamnan synthesis F family protein n=1 Tax=Roseovarius aquimarinus TaxID=1229156 RepID=A0ABW7IAH9_9RHOB
MKNIPLWKIKRELARIPGQIWKIPGATARYWLSTPYYDNVLSAREVITSGQLDPSKRVVIVVIFPLNGIQLSHLKVLEYFSQRGFAPLLVSNLPIERSSLQLVEARCWKVIQRPNFGYDFGAYRSGVLYLEKILADLEQLVLINDSTWFPLPGSEDWLNAVESLDLDYTSAATSYGYKHVRTESYKDMEWEFDTFRKNFHYCSYALSIRPNVLKDRKFLKFWKSFRLSNDKRITVRRGEMGLSKWVITSGYSHGSTWNEIHLQHELHKKTPRELKEILKALILSEEHEYSLIDRITGSYSPSYAWKKEAISAVLAFVAFYGVSYVMAADLASRGFPFLKKSPAQWNVRSSICLLNTIENLDQGDSVWLHKEAVQLASSIQHEARTESEEISQ